MIYYKTPERRMSIPLHVSFQQNVTHLIHSHNITAMTDHESWKFILEGIALPLVGFFGVTGLSLSLVRCSVSLTIK